MKKKFIRATIAATLAFAGGAVALATGGDETTATVTAVANVCADAQVPAVTYSDGADRTGTIAGASDHRCETATVVETYTIPTVTVTETTTTTVTEQPPQNLEAPEITVEPPGPWSTCSREGQTCNLQTSGRSAMQIRICDDAEVNCSPVVTDSPPQDAFKCQADYFGYDGVRNPIFPGKPIDATYSGRHCEARTP